MDTVMIFITTLLSITYTLGRTERILGGGSVFFLLSNIIAIALEIMVVILRKKKIITDTKIHLLLQAIILTIICRTFIQFEISCMEDNTLACAKEIISTTLFQTVGILMGFLIGSFANAALFKLASIVSVVALPLCEIAMTFSKETNGSRCILNLGPFSVVSLAVFTILLPFCVGFLIEADPFNTPLGWKKVDLKTKHFITVVYTLLLGSMLVINKDLGTFMVLAGCTFFAIYPTLNKASYKAILIFGACAGLTILTKSSHTFQSRLNDLFLKVPDSDTMYFLQSYQRSGFFGAGQYATSLARFPHQAEDYILQVICTNHGLIFASGIVIVLATLLILLWKMKQTLHHSRYFSTFARSVIIVYGLPFIYCTMCALLISPITGIPVPLLGKGTSLTFTYSMFITMIAGIYYKNTKERGN